ncbi:xylanase/chitin deacetylase [Natrinema limicola JCM 13563]|uniref:Xylanase/chitin deacetylase n=2 Tax=Natrinema limicola TaxID=370323 RepID=M0C3B9_9EURY|nr:xylanase/chitin deacetylase [Natrinema limicola JCM 13563]
MDDGAHNVIMSDSQIQALADDPLFALGNHTSTHPNLKTVTDENQRREEIVGGKQAIEDRFGVTVDRFAYPYGKFDDTAARIVAETHDIAVASEPSLIGLDRDAYRLPRIDGCQPASVLCFEMSDISHRLRMLMRRIG